MGDLMPYRAYRRTDLRRYYAHAMHILGRRGLTFILLGWLWLMQSIAYALSAVVVTSTAATVVYSGVALTWLLSGLAGIAGSTRPQGRDKLATVGLYAAPAVGVILGGIRVALWATRPLVEALVPATLAAHIPDGSRFGVVEVIGYGCLALVVINLSGWREGQHARGSS